MKELLYWVWYSQVFPYGSDLPRQLLAHLSSPEEIYHASDEALLATGLLNKQDVRVIRTVSLKRAEMILKTCETKQIQVLEFYSKRYPQRLKNIFGPPMVLYVLGSLGAIDRELAIGVVGTRHPSDYGTKMTKRLCGELAKAGMTIVSGCATGIDACAHGAAVTQNTRTIAVLGCGVDVDYPYENRELKLQILQGGGALISEVPPGSEPTRSIFPIRNRLISALSLGVLITEAPERSGALITANHAVEQGKDVFCVPPHDIFSQKFSGVSRLIRDGAICVCSTADILVNFLENYPYKLEFEQDRTEFLTPPKSTQKHASMPRVESEPIVQAPNMQKQTLAWNELFTPIHKQIFDLLTESPQQVDELINQSDFSMQEILPILTELEIDGFVLAMPGNSYQKTDIEIIYP